LSGLEAYNRDNKVEPMQRAIEELNVGTWFSGLRRDQSIERAKTPFVERSGDRFKVYPIADWTDRDIYNYLKKHDLPYHPLWEKGTFQSATCTRLSRWPTWIPWKRHASSG